MARYHVNMQMILSTTVTVVAEDEQAAIAAAFDSNEMPTDSICAQCSGWGQPWSVDNGEWDLADENAVELVQEDN